MSNEGNSGANLVLTFALGALVGAALTALLTPYTGPEARRRLGQMKDDLEDRAEDMADSARQRVRDAVDRGRDYVEKGRDYMDEKKHVIESAVQAGKEAYLKEKEKFTQDI